MIYYRITDKTNECIEQKYFWYYPEGYTCVDARYVGINYGRSSALRSVESFFYKLMYLNDGITIGQLVDEGLSLIKKAKMTKGIYVTEYDIHYIAENCFNEEFSRKMIDMIYEEKKIMWKYDLSDLFVMSKEEIEQYNRLSGSKKDKFMSEFRSRKKQKEALTFLNKIKSMGKRDLIIETIKIINEEKGSFDKCYINEVVERTKISFNTVKRHYEDYVSKVIRLEGYDLVVNKNEINKQDKINELQSVVNEMKLNNDKINKNSVSEKSGVSRTTVTKHWDKLNK
jgi:NADH:ubiquinone oxidoreductase subunit E